MKRVNAFMVVLVLCLALAAPCPAQNASLEQKVQNKKVAAPKGTLAGAIVLERFARADIVPFDSTEDCVAALKAGRVDAVAYDEPVLRTFLRANPDLVMLPELVRADTYGLAISPKRRDLQLAADSLIVSLRRAGRLKAMEKNWFGESGKAPAMPSVKITPRKGNTLVLGTYAQVAPFSYKNSAGALVGFDIELARRIAAAMNADLVIREMPFERLIPAAAGGEVDMAAACITMTPERAGRVLFSEPYYDGGIAVLVKK